MPTRSLQFAENTVKIQTRVVDCADKSAALLYTNFITASQFAYLKRELVPKYIRETRVAIAKHR